MIAEDSLIEHACYVGDYYGTPESYVEEQMAAGRDVILEIGMQGALEVKEIPGHTAFICNAAFSNSSGGTYGAGEKT